MPSEGLFNTIAAPCSRAESKREDRAELFLERRTLLNPLACRYHSLIEFSVLFLDKSNMNKMATASLQTSGSIVTNLRFFERRKAGGVNFRFFSHVLLSGTYSRDPPRSQTEKVI